MYEHLFKDLTPTPAEQKVIDAAARGVPADFQTGDEEKDDAANAESWGEERKVRAEILFALLVEGRAGWPAHPQGIWVYGAEITGWLDLSNVELGMSLHLIECRFAYPIILRDRRAKFLNLSGSHAFEISGDRLIVTGNINLRRMGEAVHDRRIQSANPAFPRCRLQYQQETDGGPLGHRRQVGQS